MPTTYSDGVSAFSVIFDSYLSVFVRTHIYTKKAGLQSCCSAN